MKLLYLHVRDLESLYKDTCIHFDPKWRFEEKGDEIWCSRSEVAELPNGFFSIGGKSPIEGVTAIVGKNGCGKTSLACLLKDIRSGGKFQYDFTLIYEGVLPTSTDKDKRYWIVHSYREGDSGARVRYVDPIQLSVDGCSFKLELKEVPSFISLENFTDYVYFSPHFTTENPFLWTNGDMINLSTTGLFVQDPISLYQREERRTAAPTDVSLGGYAFDERRRILEFAAAFYALPKSQRKTVPFPLPLRVRLMADGQTLARMRRLFEGKKDGLIRENREQADKAIHDLYSKLMNACEKILSVIAMYERGCLTAQLFIVFAVAHCSDMSLLDSYHEGKFHDAFGAELLELFDEKFNELIREDAALAGYLCKRLRTVHGKLKRREGKESDDAARSEDALNMFLQWRQLIAGHGPQYDALGGSQLVVELSEKKRTRTLCEVMRFHRRSMLFSTSLVLDFAPAISSGEMAYMTLFGRLASHFVYGRVDNLSRENKRDVVVFADEAETTLHPEWQRGLFWNLLWFFENFASEFRIHLIVASHSPVFLSDIPVGHCVFLERTAGKDGDFTHIVDVLEKARGLNFTNTFAANIFDLYYLSFFLEEGTIGKFASMKLKQLQECNGEMDEKSKRETLALIGDSFVRNYLRNGMKFNG